LFLAAIIALALLLGALGMTTKAQTAKSASIQVAYGVCWKCTGG
jgi:hypothetical protein